MDKIPPGRSSWVTLLLMFSAAALFVVAVCSAFYASEAHTISATALDNENRRMDRFVGLFGHDVGESITDLRLLISGDGFETYLASGQAVDLQRAARRAAYFSKENPDFDQIRYIDETGKEVFRINQGGVIVPETGLQNKANRSYFQKTNVLNADEIFISRIDLNIENGVIEQPLKPMLRVASPAFDASGKRRGIYIINILAGNMIQHLRDFVPRYADRLRMLNPEGYWVASATPDEEWGFQLRDRSGATLAKTNPELWAKILAQPTGQAPWEGGYFTWARANPADFYPGKPVKLVPEEEFLVFGSMVTPQVWEDQFVRTQQTSVLLAMLLLVLAGGVTWFFRARRQAAQERDRFFNLTRDMLCIAGFDGFFKRVNPAWEVALGYTAEEMKLKPFIDLVHPDDREKTIAEMRTLQKGGEVVGFENRYRCKDGSYRWLLWSARPLVEERLIYGSARDLTERKQIEERLRQSEERLRLMMESVKDYAIIMLDPGGRVISWNAGAQRINGYAAEEIVGKHFSVFYTEEQQSDRHPDKELLEAAEKGRHEVEDIRVRKDGSNFWANVIINAIRNPQGELIGFAMVVRDITARREAEERIQNLNKELQQRAGLLETANKELESFSYSVSHDLRAPLRHIHGFVELLQKSPLLEDDTSAQRYMAVIAKAAKEMGHLIDDLLAFSRTSRAEMHPTRIEMNEVVRHVIGELEMECQGRTVTWDVEPLPAAAGDPALIRLVWANLLGNAVKYTRSRPEAKIEIGEMAPGTNGNGNGNGAAGQDAVYYVRDNGVGFDMQYASKLFGVFQRLHRSEDFEGTGIGLANVQRIILRHHGRVWADAKVDGGATFYFSLPVIPSPR